MLLTEKTQLLHILVNYSLLDFETLRHKVIETLKNSIAREYELYFKKPNNVLYWLDNLESRDADATSVEIRALVVWTQKELADVEDIVYMPLEHDSIYFDFKVFLSSDTCLGDIEGKHIKLEERTLRKIQVPNNKEQHFWKRIH